MVAARLYGPALAPIDAAALAAAPGEFREGKYFGLKGVVDRDGQFSVSIHLRHLAEKVRSVVRSAFKQIILPLMDHFMSKGADEFIAPVRMMGHQRLEKRQGQADLPLCGFL